MSRQQTPPDIKWLLNELAAARGELDRIASDLEKAHAHLRRLEEARGRHLALCVSLEKALSLSSVVWLRTDTFVVKAHKKYGGRGNLRQWLKAALTEAYPHAPTGLELLQRAVPEFGIEFTSPGARAAYYRNTVHRQLYHLAEQGLAERVAVQEGAIRVRWRWVPQLTLAELKAKHLEDLS
ncbi:hypothetical protein [Hydrogenophaga sp. IBVHS1]|uniref:hypothetical protein n=1 Tax=unclassified Hydrogenophaga TaxID=2610897 RepID=UPI000A2D16FE|nr:hypothetical protein [Hydrogenophaga sp. IBVHS1]OSZ71552.1 hypothetical protein CAP37_20250 [Hydrogenophaga sp. IBVHS1]